MLKCGAAETVITRVKDKEEVYADLFARALVLANADQRLAIITLDIGTIDNAYAEVLLAAISKAADIPADNILVSTIQTHNAPGVDDRDMTPESRKWLADTLAELTKSAACKLQPATLKHGRAPVQVGYNRRLMMPNGHVEMYPNYKGAVVPWVDVLAAYGKDGKRIAVLFSHAAHPVIIHWLLKDKIGADFPGFAVNHLRNLLLKDGDAEGVFMFAQGCCGNINGYPLRGGLDAADVAGFSLAFAVTQALTNAKEVGSERLEARSMTISLPLQDPPSVAECKKVLAEKPDDKRYQGLLQIAESGKPQFNTFPMRALAIGDVCLVAFKGEMFAEYQLWLDKASPFSHTFVFSHTNGYSGYMATKEDYELGPNGGYESWGHPTSYSPWLAPKPSVEKIIQDNVLRLLTKLR